MRATIIDKAKPNMAEVCFVMVRFYLNNFNRSKRFYNLIMRLHTSIIVWVSILLLGSISARAQEVASRGELRVYPRTTQMGTVANRQFKNANGRIVKIIYYTYAADSMSNFREELLREQSSRTWEYDKHGCPVKSENYDQQHNLTGTEEVRCLAGTATASLMTLRNPLGIKQRETRYAEAGSVETVLEFDSNGEKVIGMSGKTPADVDLVHGWGEVVQGLALGIAASRESGPQQDLNVYVTIKNINNHSSLMVAPVLLELRDANGQVIQENAVNATLSNECPDKLKISTPYTGVVLIQFSFGLGERYSALPPGKYSLTVTYCVSDVPDRLVSNTIQLQVN
jgi:hypothetical protein